MSLTKQAIDLAEENQRQVTELLALSNYWSGLYFAAERVIKLCVSQSMLATPEQKAAFEQLQELQKKKP